MTFDQVNTSLLNKSYNLFCHIVLIGTEYHLPLNEATFTDRAECHWSVK